MRTEDVAQNPILVLNLVLSQGESLPEQEKDVAAGGFSGTLNHPNRDPHLYWKGRCRGTCLFPFLFRECYLGHHL